MIKKFLIKQAVKVVKKEIDKHDEAKHLVNQVTDVVSQAIDKVEAEAEKRGGITEFITRRTIDTTKKEINKYT